MRNIHLINNACPDRGGAQKILQNVIDARSEIFTCSNFSNLVPFFLQKIFWPLGILLLILIKRPDIVIIHSRCFLPMTIFFNFFGIKNIFYTHAHYRKYNILFKLFPCDYYISVSNSVYKYLILNKVVAKKIFLLKNPILSSEIVVPRYLFSNEELNIAFIGSLEPWKGVLELIDLLNLFVINNKVRVQLSIVGSGSLQDEIKKKLLSKVPLFCINLLGYSREPYRLISASPIVIIPSFEEGFGLVAIESIFHSKSILYNDIPALSEVCAEDDFSQAFDITDYKSFEESLIRLNKNILSLAEESTQRKRRDYIHKNYGLKPFLEKYESIISDILVR